MDSTASCTNSARIRINNRQARNRRREKEHRSEVIAWCIGKKCTCGCGQDADVAHHVSDDLYKDDEAYLDLANCDPYYHQCHSQHHRGYCRCPKCRGWMKRGREQCAKCEGWRSVNIRLRKIRHPCRFNLGKQKCTLRIACPFTPKKAPTDCNKFQAREMRK